VTGPHLPPLPENRPTWADVRYALPSTLAVGVIGVGFLAFGIASLLGYVSQTAQIVALFATIPVGAFFTYIALGVIYYFATGRRPTGAQWLQRASRTLLTDLSTRRRK